MTTKTRYLAYTDYPLYEEEYGKRAPTRQIEVLSYDNNKYARVRNPEDGHETEIKAGYILRDVGLQKRFPRITWYLLGGGDRRQFRPRERKRTWRVQVSSGPSNFDTLQKALRVAVAHAKVINDSVMVYEDVYERTNHGSHWYGRTTVYAYPDGLCVKFRRRHQKVGRCFQFKG